MTATLKIGELLRHRKEKDPSELELDGLRNYFNLTHCANSKRALLESGINSIEKVKAIDGSCCPAILISSSPHKAGTSTTL